MAIRNWGQTTNAGSDYNTDWCRIMGGNSPNINNMVLMGVGLFVGVTHTKQVRIAVYQGGTTTLPTGAALLEDLGQTTGSATNSFITIASSTNPTIVKNTVTWIAIKGNTSGGIFSARATVPIPPLSHFFSAQGRTDVAAMGSDDTAAFPSTVPSGGVNADFWYAFYLYYSYEPAIKDWSIYSNHGTGLNNPVFTDSFLKKRSII